MQSNTETPMALKVFKTVRAPGCVQYVWDYRLIIFLFLGMEIATLAVLGYVFLSIMKPAEGSNEFLIAGGVLLFVGIGTVVFTAVFLRLQGAVHVNEVKSMIEVFKGLGLSTRVHTLRFHTLEKMVLKSPAASRLRSDSPPPNVASDQIVIYLKTGEEIKLAFARLNRQQGLQVVKEIAELAGIPAFDGKGQPLRESRAVTPHSG